MLRATWYEGTAQLLSLKELKSHLFELYFVGWIIKLMKEGRKPEYPEKTPSDELQKMPHTTTQRFKPQARLEPAQQHWWQARKADMLTITPHVVTPRIVISATTCVVFQDSNMVLTFHVPKAMVDLFEMMTIGLWVSRWIWYSVPSFILSWAGNPSPPKAELLFKFLVGVFVTLELLHKCSTWKTRVHTRAWPLPNRPVLLGWMCQEYKTPINIALGVTEAWKPSHHFEVY